MALRRGAKPERTAYTEKQKFGPNIELFGPIFFYAPGLEFVLMAAFAKLRNPHFAF